MRNQEKSTLELVKEEITERASKGEKYISIDLRTKKLSK